MKATRFAMIILAFASLMLSPPAAAAKSGAAKTLYAQQIAPIYASTSDHGTAIGSITPGTPLQVSGKTEHGLQTFTLDGWSQQGDT